MAHLPSPKGAASPPSQSAAPAPHGHASAEDEYLVTPTGSGHEHTDANVRIIVKFGLWLAISSVVISAGIGLLFWLFVKQSEETVSEFPLTVGQEHRLPAAPRLQQFPVTEMYEFQHFENDVLQKYGWVDKEAGVVRMPIAEAMKLAVERGLPARAPATGEATAGQPAAAEQTQPDTAPWPPGLMPADSSSGRTMEQRR